MKGRAVQRDPRVTVVVDDPTPPFAYVAIEGTAESTLEQRDERRFEPGGRTHWHSHPNGQYLHVVEGEGRVQSRGGEVGRLLPNDTICAEPGEHHWHGAG